MARPTKRLQGVIQRHQRVAVVGGPVTGKSVLTDYALSTGKKVIHSDDFKFATNNTPWSKQSNIVKDACCATDSFVVAGIVADRAVRKGLEVDCIVLSTDPRQKLKPGQKTLKKQIESRAYKLALDKGIPLYIHTRDDEDA